MGLRMNSVVPVDTHVIKLTAENYLSTLKTKKTIGKELYRKIGENNDTLLSWTFRIVSKKDLIFGWIKVIGKTSFLQLWLRRKGSVANIDNLQRQKNLLGAIWFSTFGEYAGWAHSVLFSSKLHSFTRTRNKLFAEKSVKVWSYMHIYNHSWHHTASSCANNCYLCKAVIH